jgi:6-phosphogluconolactonase (cycloisomerase 2 family)
VLVSSTSGNCNTAAATSGVFYVLNQVTNQIVALSGTSTGSVNTIGANNLLVSANPTYEPAAIAVAPNGKFLYVSTDGGIYLYSIESNGALTVGYSGQPIAGLPYLANSMQVDSTNSWLVFTVSGLSQLYAFAINSSNGLPAVAGEQPETSPLPANSTPLQLVISPNDSNSCGNCYVFVAMGAAGTETVLFNPASANPFVGTGNISVFNNQSGRSDNTIAVDPKNRLLYIGETADISAAQTGGLRAFTFTGSGTHEISGSPYSSGGTGPSSILPSADGSYVYVANEAVSGSTTDNIASYSVPSSVSTTSPLIYITTTATTGPTGRISLAEDSTGTYLFAADYAGNPDLQAFSMSSGTLTSLFTANFGATSTGGSYAIAALP